MAESEPRARVTLSAISATFGAVMMGCLGLLTLLQDPLGVPRGVVPLGAGVAGLFIAPVIPALVRAQDERHQAESHQRVLTAEHDLEIALQQLQTNYAPNDNLTPPEDGRQVPASRTEELPGDAQPRLALPELWAVTHRRLDHYHGIALGQARQSFRNAQIAMMIGFALLAAFTAIALTASTTAGSVVAGGLGAASAALAGYVSRTFIKSQETAAGHLRAYFDQPLEFSRYLAAERLVADANLSEERRSEVVSLLVQAMIAGPSPQGLADTNTQQPGNSS